MAMCKVATIGLSALVLVGCMSTGTAVGPAPANAQSKKTDQVRSISPEEKKQGAEAHPQLLAEFGGAYDGPQTPYVVSVGQNIAVQSGLGNARADFTVTLLNSPVNNAFAIPGGYVYLTRQLMALMNDEAEMAGVLGHEVGHVAARHSEKRRKAATRNSILGVLGSVAGGFLGNSGGLLGTLGGALQNYSGTVAQLFTLKYSRKQEEDADDLGIQYLKTAGYDSMALSTMLESLAAQSAIDARAAGRSDARSLPEWASTHPEPAKRVARAAKNATAAGSVGGNRNRAAFLRNLNGVLYGDDPKQGVIEGNSFLHPDLRLKFIVPSGFGMQNGARAVTISGQSGQAQFTTAAYTGNLSNYIDSAFKAIGGDKQTIPYGPIQSTTINGLPAAYSSARVTSGNRQLDVTVFAYQFANNSAFHFVSVTPAGQASVFNGMYQSVSRLSSGEAAAIKPRKLQVVTIKRGDTIASLAQRMAYSDLQQDRFLVLNRMKANDTLTAGQQVKIVTY
jgi:predicted Zn-dependent protease